MWDANFRRIYQSEFHFSFLKLKTMSRINTFEKLHLFPFLRMTSILSSLSSIFSFPFFLRYYLSLSILKWHQKLQVWDYSLARMKPFWNNKKINLNPPLNTYFLLIRNYNDTNFVLILCRILLWIVPIHKTKTRWALIQHNSRKIKNAEKHTIQIGLLTKALFLRTGSKLIPHWPANQPGGSVSGAFRRP